MSENITFIIKILKQKIFIYKIIVNRKRIENKYNYFQL
jgi:hypothetical protein